MKIPYQSQAAVALEQRRAQMLSAIARPLPRLDRRPIDESATLSIACYGPSLKDTWQFLERPILSMSGATKWLYERGVVADYHIDMDARAHKAMTSLPPVPGVTYLVASVCTPAYFDALQDANVVLWHTVSSNWDDELKWVSEHDPGQFVICGGTTIGLTAVHLGGLMGFRRFAIHGMDSSFANRDGTRHAGPHHGKVQPVSRVWPAAGKKYYTTPIMSNAAAESVNLFQDYPIIGVFYGDGLTQALIREANLPNACCADEFEKRKRLSSARVNIADLPPIPKGRTAWDGFLEALAPHDLPELILNSERCEERRAKARYNTGSVPMETALLLRAMCRYYRPQVIAEVGTFIGTSTEAMLASRAIYTCDRSNDCLPRTDTIWTHPYQSSTEMLREIHEPVDFFFFDGRIQPEDVPEIRRVSHAKTVYAFDDCTGVEKGTVNIAVLSPHLKDYALVAPFALYKERSTLAALVPSL
jgi:hypothetical protein